MCLVLIIFFRHFVNGRGKFGQSLAQQSYAACVVHIPIIVFLAHGLRGIGLGSLPKAGVLAAIAVPTCLAVAFVVRKIPLASQVLWAHAQT